MMERQNKNTIFRILRFVSIFGGWLCFFVYLNDNSQVYFVYAIPFILTFAIILGPLQKQTNKIKLDEK